MTKTCTKIQTKSLIDPPGSGNMDSYRVVPSWEVAKDGSPLPLDDPCVQT